MRVYNMAQGSPEWYAIRKGRPTASCFGKIITPAKGEYAKGADTYAAELIAESLGWQSGFHGSPDTDRGHRLEKEAVRWLAMRYGLRGRDVGFCMSDCGRYGSSVDHLLTGDIPAEIKAPDTHTFLKWRVQGKLPDDHKAQCHGHMWVTGADRCIFLAYADHPALENWMIEVKRDDFTEKLGACVSRFCERLDELREELLGEEVQFYTPTIPSE